MDDDSFTLDITPTQQFEYDIPRYSVSRKSLELTKVEEQVAQRSKSQYVNQNPCWNCGKPLHAIRDCPAEQNSITIEWNKEIQMFMKGQQGFNKGGGRYHENERTNKYEHIIPGTASSELRKAMGLSENDLPTYVYRLRKHGYPKAWLRHASIKPSGLNLYDAHGKEVADPDAEDGEILEEEDKIRYDLSKLIKFPGFNAPAPENAVDDYEKMDAPAYSETHSLEKMISDLQEKAMTEYRLKKDRIKAKKESISNGNEPVADEMSSSSSKDCVLQAEEDSTSSLITQNTGYASLATQDSDYMSQDALRSQSHDESQTSISPSEESLGRVLSSIPGTPILRSQSGHSKLPPAENFSKDICDVINFENLPESTGKFEKMRSLLKKVKKVLGLERQQKC